MKYERNKTRQVKVGNVKVGGNAPVSIQSMTNTNSENVEATVSQIQALTAAGCEIVRIAVPNEGAAIAIKEIKKQITIPLVADIHFDYKLALKSMESGVDKLRINPGNIGDELKIKEVVAAANHYGVPIRIGVNGGSLEKEILERHKAPTPLALFESAMSHVRILEKFNFENIIISVKSSNTQNTLEAYSLLSVATDYPLHIGVTEAGTIYSGSIKSAVGIGAMLLSGIGDTLRVSLTGDPLEEIRCAKEILKATELRNFGARLISCPTCGRTEINMIELANKVEEELKTITKPITVAVMGCVVNGPGEAKEADIGVAGGKGKGVIFKKGEVFSIVEENKLLEALLTEIRKM